MRPNSASASTGNREKSDLRKFSNAGYMSIVAACIIGINIILVGVIGLGIASFIVIAMVLSATSLVQMILTTIVFIRFKNFIDKTFGSNTVDTLVILVLLGELALTTTALLMTILVTLNMTTDVVSFLTIIGVAIPVAVIGIIFGIKLLNLKGEVNLLLKSMAFIFISKSLVLGLILLSAVFLVIPAVFNMTFMLLLGILLMRGIEEPREVEFV